MDLVDELIGMGYLKTKRIIKAFRAIKREDFLPRALGDGRTQKQLAQLDEALPIGFGQTISQPSVVAFMLELLNPLPGQKILDIGAGSGWTTALLAKIASNYGAKGRVVAIEMISALKEFGQNNVAKYNFISKKAVRYEQGDGSLGFETEAPYDRILASATAQKILEVWIEQLKPQGIIVAPVGNSILKLTKDDYGNVSTAGYPGFVFVSLVSG